MALKDTLDGVLIGDSFATKRQPSWMFLRRHLYIHDSAAGGYPILVNLDENNNPTKDEKYGQERLEYANSSKQST
jgi:hypothetical protein